MLRLLTTVMNFGLHVVNFFYTTNRASIASSLFRRPVSRRLSQPVVQMIGPSSFHQTGWTTGQLWVGYTDPSASQPV